jgi:hypothetical protein
MDLRFLGRTAYDLPNEISYLVKRIQRLNTSVRPQRPSATKMIYPVDLYTVELVLKIKQKKTKEIVSKVVFP